MAIASLALVFNNPDVFKYKGVKTRKGEAVKIMRNNPDISSATYTFLEYITLIKKKADPLRLIPLEKENYKKLDEYIKDVIIVIIVIIICYFYDLKIYLQTYNIKIN